MAEVRREVDAVHVGPRMDDMNTDILKYCSLIYSIRTRMLGTTAMRPYATFVLANAPPPSTHKPWAAVV